MSERRRSILLLGESNVGKTHYGAQFLKRLIAGGCSLRMDGAATNLQPFEDAMNSLAEGRATGHTSANTYVESIWPVADGAARGEMVWPDYGGEQIRALITDRKIPMQWRDRIVLSTDWILLIRLHTMHTADDVFSRPIPELGRAEINGARHQPSDQSRQIELLQMLIHVAGLNREVFLASPTLTVLLSCWDEIEVQGKPFDVMRGQLPMLASFINATWRKPTFLGLSALEKPLSQTESDKEYAIRGPERFGYIVLPDGSRSNDITLPIQQLLTQA